MGALRLYPATPGRGVPCGCVCLGSGSGVAPPLLAGVLVAVCVCVCTQLVPRHSWRACAVRVCVLGLGSRLRPSTSLGCWGVPFPLCALRLRATNPRWRAGCGCVGCALPLLAGVLLGVCVCLCARSACTPPLLAGVCGVGVCAWARVSAAPRHFWLGCWCVCVFVCAPRLYPASPGWVVRCGCVYFGSGFGCALLLLAGVLVCVCVCLCAHSACTPPVLAWLCGVGVCAWARVLAAPRHSSLGCWWVSVFVCPHRLYPATPDGSVRCVCVCLGPGFGCAPPLLARVLGCVCVCVRALLVPHQFRLGCAVWVFVLALGFRLRPATPGWGVPGCVCLAGFCGVGVCAWARVLAAPRYS